MEALLVQIRVLSTEPTVRLTFKALTTMKLLVLMWLLLQPSSTPLKEKSLAYSINMPTLGRDHPFIHQVNLNGLRPMLMKNLSTLVVPNLSLLWMDILSLSSSRMVWPMPPPLEDPQIRTWTHIHMSSSHLLMNGTPQSLTMILHTLMDWTPVKSLTNPLVTPCLMFVVISISISLPTSTPSWMHLQEIVGHTQKSLLFSQPISIRVHSKSLTGMLYTHFLHGHPHPASRTLSMSPPGMELLHTSKIISLNLITNTKIRLKITLDLPSFTPTLSRTPLVALLASGYSVCSTSVLYSTTWHLQLFKVYALFKLWKELLQTLVSCSISHIMSLSTTGLILLSLISTFLHYLMKRRVIGSVCRQPR